MGSVFSRKKILENGRRSSTRSFQRYSMQESVPPFEPSLQGVASYILESDTTNVVVLTGAGISLNSWLSEIRQAIDKVDKSIASFGGVRTLLDAKYFNENPNPLYKECRKLLHSFEETPSFAHLFVKVLEEKGKLLRHYTENMDDLERLSGVPEEKVVQANGTFERWICSKCRQDHPKVWVLGKFALGEEPVCMKCEAYLRPDIVLFGEPLPKAFFLNSRNDMSSCDFMIIMGSTLSVEPFSCLPTMVKKTVPRLVMNESSMSEDLGFQFGTRDVLWNGTPDNGCLELARFLGWDGDLRQLKTIADRQSIISY